MQIRQRTCKCVAAPLDLLVVVAEPPPLHTITSCSTIALLMPKPLHYSYEASKLTNINTDIVLGCDSLAGQMNTRDCSSTSTRRTSVASAKIQFTIVGPVKPGGPTDSSHMGGVSPVYGCARARRP